MIKIEKTNDEQFPYKIILNTCIQKVKKVELLDLHDKILKFIMEKEINNDLRTPTILDVMIEGMRRDRLFDIVKNNVKYDGDKCSIRCLYFDSVSNKNGIHSHNRCEAFRIVINGKRCQKCKDLF